MNECSANWDVSQKCFVGKHVFQFVRSWDAPSLYVFNLRILHAYVHLTTGLESTALPNAAFRAC